MPDSWRIGPEYIEAAEAGAKVILPFSARDVFFVASSPAPSDVHLLVDGGPVPATATGKDAPGGVVHVGRSDLYALLRFALADSHQLTLEAAPGFRLYTFTFG